MQAPRAPVLVRYRFQAYPSAPWRTFYVQQPVTSTNLVRRLIEDRADLKRFPVVRYTMGDQVRLLESCTTAAELKLAGADAIHLWLDAGDPSFFVSELLREPTQGLRGLSDVKLEVRVMSQEADKLLASLLADRACTLEQAFKRFLHHAATVARELGCNGKDHQEASEDRQSWKCSVPLDGTVAPFEPLNRESFGRHFAICFLPAEASGNTSLVVGVIDQATNLSVTIKALANQEASAAGIFPVSRFFWHWTGNTVEPLLDPAMVHNMRALRQRSLYSLQLERLEDNLFRPYFTRGWKASRPQGALLYGPPGTGKSVIANELLEVSGMRIIFSGSASSFFGGLVGDTEKNISKAFDQALRTPHLLCVMFIDEFDSLAQDREHSKGQEHKKDFLNHFISLVGSTKYKNVVIIACTNFKDKLDPAVLRYGRLNEHFLFGVLTARDRLSYLRKVLPELSLSLPERSILLRLTLNFTIAMLNELASQWGGQKPPIPELFSKAVEIASRGDSSKFNKLCSTTKIEKSSHAAFENQILKELEGRWQGGHVPTGRLMSYIPLSVDGAKDKSSLVWEYCDGKSFSFTLDRNSRGTILQLLQQLASLYGMQHVRLIDRDFYLRHKDSFKPTLQDFLDSEAPNYESSMLVFLVDDLIGLGLANATETTSESNNISKSTSQSTTEGKTEGTTDTDSKSDTDTTGTTTSTSASKGKNITVGEGKTKNLTKSETYGTGTSKSYGLATSHSTATNRSTSTSETAQTSEQQGTSHTEGSSQTYSVQFGEVLHDIVSTTAYTMNYGGQTATPFITYVFDGTPTHVHEWVLRQLHWGRHYRESDADPLPNVLQHMCGFLSSEDAAVQQLAKESITKLLEKDLNIRPALQTFLPQLMGLEQSSSLCTVALQLLETFTTKKDEEIWKCTEFLSDMLRCEAHTSKALACLVNITKNFGLARLSATEVNKLLELLAKEPVWPGNAKNVIQLFENAFAYEKGNPNAELVVAKPMIHYFFYYLLDDHVLDQWQNNIAVLLADAVWAIFKHGGDINTFRQVLGNNALLEMRVNVIRARLPALAKQLRLA